MGEAYPELGKSRAYIEKVLLAEEQRFAETLEQGLKLLDEVMANLKGKKIAGEDVFRLYDTYGFPVDLTRITSYNVCYTKLLRPWKYYRRVQA